ncbi:MAG: hypothetical protein ABJQ29_06370 [Luteolibacter sp.]
MSSSFSEDAKMKDLIGRVGDDISQLRSDISSFFSHTSRHTLPTSARDLRDSARERLHAGSDFAASQLRYLRENPTRSSIGITGGLLLLGAVGAGIYYLCKSDCCHRNCSSEETDESTPPEDLPPYIS